MGMPRGIIYQGWNNAAWQGDAQSQSALGCCLEKHWRRLAAWQGRTSLSRAPSAFWQDFQELQRSGAVNVETCPSVAVLVACEYTSRDVEDRDQRNGDDGDGGGDGHATISRGLTRCFSSADQSLTWMATASATPRCGWIHK